MTTAMINMCAVSKKRRRDDDDMRRHAGMPRTRRGSPPASKYDEVGGPQKLNFFQSRVTKKIKTPKFHVTCSFYSRESKSLLPPPPSQWCSTLPPRFSPFARKIPRYAWESIKRPT